MNVFQPALVPLFAFLISSASPGDRSQPYLTPRLVPNGVQILPPPPALGSPAASADRAIFQQTRKLKGSARWRIAIDDVNNAPLARYACAMNMVVTPATAPALAHLLDEVGTGEMVDPVKQHYRVARPYLREPGPICQPRTHELDSNGDYPSGHAANGWLEALVLANLIPSRATQILTRGRQYGESRIVCGVHSASAVAAGWTAGSAMFVTLSGGSSRFRRDMKLASNELSSLRSKAPRPDTSRCAADSAALADHPW